MNRQKELKSFKIPKKIERENLKAISINSLDFLNEIKPALVNNLMRESSFQSFQFHEAFLLHHAEAEKSFAQKRLNLKELHVDQEISGFILIEKVKNVSSAKHFLNDLMNDGGGFVKCGNLSTSMLADPKFGVSVSSFADLFSPVAHKEFALMLLVKCLPGRINWVAPSESQFDPQPGFDSHQIMYRQCEEFKSNSLTQSLAFHYTQMFLYEYNEVDLTLLEYPTNVLPWAAVCFNWTASTVYPISLPAISSLSHKISDQRKDVETNSASRLNLQKVTSTSLHQKAKLANILELQTEIVARQLMSLQAGNSLWSNNLLSIRAVTTAHVDVKASILGFSDQPVPLDALLNSRINISTFYQQADFEVELMKVMTSETKKFSPQNLPKFNFKPNDSINQYESIKLPSNANKHFMSNRWFTYLRLVLQQTAYETQQSQKNMASLYRFLNANQLVALVNLNSFYSAKLDAILFLIPNCNLTRRLGITSAPVTPSFLHGILLTKNSLEMHNVQMFNQCDQKVISSLLESERKANKIPPKMPLRIIRESLNAQQKVQKIKLRQLASRDFDSSLHKYDPLSHEQVDDKSSRNQLSPGEPEIALKKRRLGDISQNFFIEDEPYDPAKNFPNILIDDLPTNGEEGEDEEEAFGGEDKNDNVVLTLDQLAMITNKSIHPFDAERSSSNASELDFKSNMQVDSSDLYLHGNEEEVRDEEADPLKSLILSDDQLDHDHQQQNQQQQLEKEKEKELDQSPIDDPFKDLDLRLYLPKPPSPAAVYPMTCDDQPQQFKFNSNPARNSILGSVLDTVGANRPLLDTVRCSSNDRLNVNSLNERFNFSSPLGSFRTRTAFPGLANRMLPLEAPAIQNLPANYRHSDYFENLRETEFDGHNSNRSSFNSNLAQSSNIRHHLPHPHPNSHSRTHFNYNARQMHSANSQNFTHNNPSHNHSHDNRHHPHHHHSSSFIGRMNDNHHNFSNYSRFPRRF